MLLFQSPPSVSQKVPVNELPPGSPMGALMERVASLKRFLLHVSRVPHKCSPDKKKFHPSLEGRWKWTSPPCSPKWGPYGNRHPFPEPYLTYPLGSPVKELSLRVPLTELQQKERERERDAPFPESSICLSKSLVNGPPSRFPSGAPMGRDAHLQSLPLHILQGPQ